MISIQLIQCIELDIISNDKEVIQRIYKIRSRENSKQLTILILSKNIAEKIVEFSSYLEKMVQKICRYIDLILKLTNEKIKPSLNVTDKITDRVPNYSGTLELLKNCKILIETSTNNSKTDPFRNPNEYMKISKSSMFSKMTE